MRKKTRATLAGFPTKLSEAITNGTPIITNSMENVLPFVKEGETGYLIDIDSPSESLEAILKILSLPSETVENMKQMCLKDTSFRIEHYVPEVKKMLGAISNGK